MKKQLYISLLSVAIGLFISPAVLAEENSRNTVPSTEISQTTTISEVTTTTQKVGFHQQDQGVTVYYFYNGLRATNQWLEVNGRFYFADENGQILKNTLHDNYYLQENGERFTNGWFFYQNHWYYAQSNGALLRNQWSKINNRWYSFTADATMKSAEWDGYYYLTANGEMAESQWIFDTSYNSWFYLKLDGTYLENQWRGDYYLKRGGYMAQSEWIYDSTYRSWFYLKEDGKYARSEWLFDPSYQKWFYLKNDGSAAEKQWVGGYYLKNGGYMAQSEWIYDTTYNGWFYLKDDGFYASNYFKIGDKIHSFRSNGVWIEEVPDGFTVGKYSKVIFLDPGHGGKDPGALYYGVAEKDLNMQIYHKLRPLLEAKGYSVLTSREDDRYVDFMTERSQMVNRTNADIFISIHFNATGFGEGSLTKGIQTYTYEPIGLSPRINHYWHNNVDRLRESKRLSKNIHSALLARTGAADDGEWSRNFAVLRETAKPAILLELGYIDNREESAIVQTEDYQDKLAAGIAEGIERYYAGQ